MTINVNTTSSSTIEVPEGAVEAICDLTDASPIGDTHEECVLNMETEFSADTILKLKLLIGGDESDILPDLGYCFFHQ